MSVLDKIKVFAAIHFMIKYLISLYKCLFIDSVAKPYFNFNRTRYGRNASLCHSENDGKCCFLKKGDRLKSEAINVDNGGDQSRIIKPLVPDPQFCLTWCHQNTVN